MDAIHPAQLSFLAIYCPALGQTDEALDDQVVYFYSAKSSRARQSRQATYESAEQQQHEERNERLRQIGLAQGMIDFAKAFSNGEPVDFVDSEKARILMHELETGWWVLASIDLTRIQGPPAKKALKPGEKPHEADVQYSAREACPQKLLLQKFLRAHAIFLLHHGPSLADLYVRLSRASFCATLERFWNRFARSWIVLLHGTPAVDIFNGLKLAAGGELGIGVGEEEWGSGEREVLEGFVGRTEGLVDIVVSRFGEAATDRQDIGKEEIPGAWLDSGKLPGAADGVVFSGTGVVTRESLRSISAWMEWISMSGQSAYGVQDSPHSGRRKRRKKCSPGGHAGVRSKEVHTSPTNLEAGIPPPIVLTANQSLATATAMVDRRQKSQSLTHQKTGGSSSASSSTDAVMKYLTLGIYGSSWGIPAGRAAPQHKVSNLHQSEESLKKENDDLNVRLSGMPFKLLEPQAIDDTTKDGDRAGLDTARGCFLIGLQGDINLEGATEEDGEDATATGTDQESLSRADTWNRRIVFRTLYVHRIRANSQGYEASTYVDRLQVIVYLRQPFIFAFLFEPRTDSLNMTSFYRDIHHQLGPLHGPMLRSTSPANVYTRLWEASSPHSISPRENSQPIYDLVYDPSNLSVHTTLPGIPEPGTVAAEGLSASAPWSRIEALNVHSQIINTYNDTRRRRGELERTCKTSRGWWIVWMRLPASSPAGTDTALVREAYLVRKASDNEPNHSRRSSLGFGREDAGTGRAPANLAEGIGIDARRYLEGLLGLNR